MGPFDWSAHKAQQKEQRRIASELHDQVAVIDVSMPGLNGLLLVERVAGECPKTPLLVLTANEIAAYVQLLLRVGAQSSLLKRSAAENLLCAARRWQARQRAAHGRLSSQAVSPRRTETLRLIAQGFSNKEITRWIDVSAKSVETYKAHAVEKLGLRTRAKIIWYGAANGWLDALTLR